jgi:hypothetical protein
LLEVTISGYVLEQGLHITQSFSPVIRYLDFYVFLALSLCFFILDVQEQPQSIYHGMYAGESGTGQVYFRVLKSSDFSRHSPLLLCHSLSYTAADLKIPIEAAKRTSS